MNKILSILLTLLIGIATTTFADTTKYLHLKFSPNQFSFDYDSLNTLTISPISDDAIFTYGDDVNEPCLPIMSLTVKVPKGSEYKDFTQSCTKSLLLNNVSIGANPISIPTNQDEISYKTDTRMNYMMSKYPSCYTKYISTATIGDSSVLYFQVCPFEYDVINKKLFFINDINLSINITNDNTNSINGQQKFINFCNTHNVNITNQISALSAKSNINDSIDYIIITSKELSPYFASLVQWKNTKGVRTIITTIEDIEKMNAGSGRSLPDKIKAYLLYMYHLNDYKFKYLLLGGDDTVVPAKYCLGKVEYIIKNKEKTDTTRYIDKIPSDIYYACLDYTTDPFWDSSNNGVYGEIKDQINFSQDIYVTRIPVRTSTDVKTTLMKIINYERNPLINGWNNNILMSGVKLDTATNVSHSNAELLGDFLYNNYIKKYWDGERMKLYDTFSDFKSEGIESLTRNNFQRVLSKGFAFIDMITHGSNTTWSMPKSSYNTSYAQDMRSSQYSLITTIACNTNAFDRAEPCLSEAFIRNFQSGVIAYVGSSRFGWYSPSSTTTGTSIEYEKSFYKLLFDKTFSNKNFGKIVAHAKSTKVGLCNSYNPYRWLQFALNPIGDAEMPVYTMTPKTIDNCNISIAGCNIYINTGIDSCNICIMSSDDDGETYYKVLKNVSKYQISDINTDTHYTICVTKQNYIPFVYNTRDIRNTNNNKIIFSGIDSNNTLRINTNLENNVKLALINISDINGNKEKTYTISSDNPTVRDDTSSLNNGIHIVSLYINDKIADSKQIKK